MPSATVVRMVVLDASFLICMRLNQATAWYAQTHTIQTFTHHHPATKLWEQEKVQQTRMKKGSKRECVCVCSLWTENKNAWCLILNLYVMVLCFFCLIWSLALWLSFWPWQKAYNVSTYIYNYTHTQRDHES